MRKTVGVFAALLVLGSYGTPLCAQTGGVTGTVRSALEDAPVPGVTVTLAAPGREDATQLTDADGRFRLDVPAGTYSLLVSGDGYVTLRIDRVVVVSGQTVDLPIRIESASFILNPIVVTASRGEQQALQAPSATSIVREEDVEKRVATSVADHVSTVPGVDAAQTGMMRTALVARGFNDVFSTALLVLTDNRYANLPATRANVLYMIPTTDLDLERIELSLGPASALYGPNATNGVMHLITKSPIEHPGTTVSVAGGERSTFQSMFRTAWAAPNEKFGFKVSGQYFTGNDWQWRDPAEEAAALADPSNPLIAAPIFRAQRWSGEARFDVRPSEGTEWITTFGSNMTENQIEVSGAGRSVAKNMRTSFVQSRFRSGRLFAQGFFNFTDGGDSYFLRTGLPAIDFSRMLVGQVQHGVELGRADLTYGVDAQRTDIRTDGTITGRYEDDDLVDEIGAYVLADVELTPELQAVGALRFDYHNRIEDPVWSPRFGLIFTPEEGHTLRATFNRAFRTPSVLDIFLDLQAGVVPIAPGFEYDLRAVGVSENGYSFGECPGGVRDACMRVPGVEGVLPADATLLWDQFIGALAPDLAGLLPNPGSAVGTVLRRFSPAGAAVGDPFPLDPVGARDLPPLLPQINNTFELGYKGLLSERLLVSGNVYYQKIRDFVGPITVETPNVFLDPATTAAYVQGQLQALVDAGTIAQSDVDALVGGLAAIPMGTVSPSEWDAADILLTYRNFGDVDLWGFEVSADFLATPELSLGGSLGFLSEDCFDIDEDGECFSPEDRALNAPKWKGAISARYDDVASGFFTEARARFVGGFPQAAGVFVGDVESYTVVDASVGYTIPQLRNATVTLSASNLFDASYRPMIGAPEFGRVAMLRVQYSF